MRGGPLRVGAILCLHGDKYLAVRVTNNAVGIYCPSCTSWLFAYEHGFPDVQGHWIPSDHPAVRALGGRDSLRRVDAEYGRCARCHEWRPLHEHHWAQRRYWLDACADWPSSWLCVPCHEEFHRMDEALRARKKEAA
jgi:hypothetical protein